MSTPAISVLMAVYNTERYVAEAVESILGQTFPDFEFIIIDDGSTDGSLSILRSYAEQDDRIRLSSRPNRGFVRTLSEGLALARGEFVARMDPDDVSLPDRLARQVEYMERHGQCVALGSYLLLIEPFGSPICVREAPLTHKDIDLELLRGRGVVNNRFLRRSAVLEAGGYDVRYRAAEDLDLCLRLAERGRLANLPEVLLKYRQHFSTITYGQYQQMWRDDDEIVRQAYLRRRGFVPDDFVPPSQTKSQPLSRARSLRGWAWAALRAGNVAVARRHAVASFCRAPFSERSWRLMYCVLRGR